MIVTLVSGEQTEMPEVGTGVQGKIYTDTNANGRFDLGEPGISGRTIITVNVADFADTQRTTADQKGDYSFELAAGTYLVQVEGTASYAYVDITSGFTTIQHLGL